MFQVCLYGRVSVIGLARRLKQIQEAMAKMPQMVAEYRVST